VYLGFLSLLITHKRQNSEFDYLFRCAGSFVYNQKGTMSYFSGSLSKIGLKSNEILLGITKLSYHKKITGIKTIQVKNYLLWECLNIQMQSGERVKIFCDSKQIKELENYLNKYSG
jgi:hypothetical protein